MGVWLKHRERLIPADAGSTETPMPNGRGWWAHPRRCGEHSTCPPQRSLAGGSSPQMRGARDDHRPHTRPPRLIPADAGSTVTTRLPSSASRAHPRRCGEHVGAPLRCAACWGSSPQMRGAPGGRKLPCVILGLIPADAGSTLRSGATASGRWAHPRRCGEHLTSRNPNTRPVGSSPQMRGAPIFDSGVSPEVGLIPADAGSTMRTSVMSQPPGAHPRRCGEHEFTTGTGEHVEGSSPQMRGAPGGTHGNASIPGLIPADAGSTIRGHARSC